MTINGHLPPAAGSDDGSPPAPIAPVYDVVVVGARVAGAATAMLLARRGRSVLVIDRGRSGSDTLSTHSIALPGVLQLRRWGLLDDVRAAGTPVTRTVVFDYGGDETIIEVPDRNGIDGLYNPRRTVIDPILVRAAVAAGADVRHGVTLRSVTTDGGGRATGVEIDVGGERRTVAARYVVGADGVRSRVAREVGARTLHQDAHGAASIYAYFDGLDPHLIVNHYDTGRAVGVIPTNDGAAVVWAGMPARRFAVEARHDVAGTHARQVAMVPDLAASLRHSRRLSGFRAFAGSPGHLRDAWGPGWALVGDAGYFTDPISAHGITAALIGAELVADAVDGVFSGADERSTFAAMQAVRDDLAAEMMPAVASACALPDDLARVRDAFRAMSAAMRREWQLIEAAFVAPVPA